VTKKSHLLQNMENELVRYSRAGDVFHYRWAARRCLRLIYPKTQLRQIVIEGSKESKLAGEYVIDVAEYSDSAEKDVQEIAYFQLKHTTIRKEQPFKLSDLKDTITGFAQRYTEFTHKKDRTFNSSIVTFSIVTNRAIAESFKRNIATIARGEIASTQFQTTLEKYTGLSEKKLTEFCALIKFMDGEGDYDSQSYELHAEISQLVAGTVDSPEVDNIVALVQGKALPNSDGLIRREDILKRFGVTSERDLYPAPLEVENLDHAIPRKQQVTILNCIVNASAPVIIHAAGGVGKSVFARQIAKCLPRGSLGVLYDCFGGGRYRNRSEPRHRYRDALVQISNELASQGLCSPLIPKSTDQEDAILRAFLARLNGSAKLLRKSNKTAILVILIDAADNAEMAAQEFGEKCFAHELLRELMPKGCRLVELCRTERKHLLHPSGNVFQVELEPFSEEETLCHLRTHFPEATEADGLEFHRLTNNGNPRVQANALNLGFTSLPETLAKLGPAGASVDKQIEAQLDIAISLVKDRFPDDYKEHIDALCFGLAALPPFIPLDILARAADVDEATVKSFIADLGRPLWLTDTSVHFRDEPTETWFRQKFHATPDKVSAYITRLEPLADKYPYIAETLPSLYLTAGKYTELIDLALSDNLLPTDNPIDERNVRIYRLQFAFKAALKLKKYADATKLALRAGEEFAGDKRQLELLRKNVDLIAPLQHEQRVQELAFRRLLRSAWAGSENVYSAALLSSVKDFQGEARGFLRAALNWLKLYFEERKKEQKKRLEESLSDDDIVEFAMATFNLDGTEKLVDFMFDWKPPQVTYRIAKKFFRRLIDANNFVLIEEVAQIDFGSETLHSQYLILAMADELLDVGRFPSRKITRQCLDLLASKDTRITIPEHQFQDTTQAALLSFLEACAVNKNSKTKILRVLNYYVPRRASRSVSINSLEEARKDYLRALALRCVLEKKFVPDLDKLIPKELLGKKKKSYQSEEEIQEFKKKVGALLPWYIVRAHLLLNNPGDLSQAVTEAHEQSKKTREASYRDSDTLPYEISHVQIDILMLCKSSNPDQIGRFFHDFLQDNKQIRISDRLKAARSAFRSNHLTGIRSELERAANEFVVSQKHESPETKADLYIEIARAVFPTSLDDAAVYFDYAIEAVSKFGDELVERWGSIVALGGRSAEGGYSSPELAYRFIRCAELVGDNVAREKYWDRNNAIRVCARLSPVSAFSALSRWRDRDVGWFDWQLPTLAEEMINANFISPTAGWAVSSFFKEDGVDEFASICIEKASSKEHRQWIVDMAVRDLRLNEATAKSLRKLKGVAEQYSINNADLDRALAFYAANPEKKESFDPIPALHSNQAASESIDWGKIFEGLELVTSSGISQAIDRFNEAPVKIHSREEFWQEIFQRVDDGEAIKFLQAIIGAEHADQFDIQNALIALPNDWRQRVSVKRNWGKILQGIAKRLALDLIHHWRFEYFLEKIQVTESEIQFLRQGILEGLSGNIELIDAGTFFGFVEIVSSFLSTQEATELLDFGLLRFELHIDDQYADGPWAKWLAPPEEKDAAFAGLIWSALGSPRAEVRWRAAHCVRRLSELQCSSEITALVQWMEQDSVGAFGGYNFPFYNLHARQYLLIALARISIDYPQIVKRHSKIFSRIALQGIPHILIQKYAAQIAINIENSFPKTYKSSVIKELHRIGVSPLPVRLLNNHSSKVKSYWHEKGEINKDLKFHHGYDFDRYWYEPLGAVFGISGDQVEELATEVVRNELHANLDGSYKNDPRSGLWDTSQNERETWHDHGSYPRADNYSFYMSYHAMLVVAAKLLQKMPIVKRGQWDGDEDQWLEWLKRHTLTRKDGRWLADRRDPAPLLQPEWTHHLQTKNWRSEVDEGDFLDALLFERNGVTWVNVYGHWSEGHSDRTEDSDVYTALVSRLASQALLNAMTAHPDPYDFQLPDYQDSHWEFHSAPFELKGWIWQDSIDVRLDELDPLASKIPYPPYQIGASIVEEMGLSVDNELREWSLPNTDQADLVCELWSTNKPRPDEDPLRHGQRLGASLDFLKKLCAIENCEIIIKIQISRRFDYRSYTRDQDGNEYRPPLTKIFILSGDGRLRDTETRYQIG
jgi:hypothetical protein